MPGDCSSCTGRKAFQSFKGIVFDCDGVLIDSKEANRQFYNHFRKLAGLPAMNAAQEDYVHAHAVDQSLKHILPQKKLDEIAALRKETRYTDFMRFIRLESGVTELLDTLLQGGFQMAICTNRTDTMPMVLERFALGRFFRPVITANMVSRSKPHPEGLQRILADWQVRPNEVVYIGDTEVDEQTARAAGVPFWAYKNDRLQAAMHVDNFWTLRQSLA